MMCVFELNEIPLRFIPPVIPLLWLQAAASWLRINPLEWTCVNTEGYVGVQGRTGNFFFSSRNPSEWNAETLSTNFIISFKGCVINHVTLTLWFVIVHARRGVRLVSGVGKIEGWGRSTHDGIWTGDGAHLSHKRSSHVVVPMLMRHSAACSASVKRTA